MTNEKINYQIKSSARSRHIRIAVYPDGRVLISKPIRTTESQALDFMHRKYDWIISKLNFYKSQPTMRLPETPISKSEVLAFVKSRVEFYNQHYGFDVGKISIKNHRTLWGSASRRRNLNFNHKIVHLRPRQADYIIVHELCHLQEFNHSPKFWSLVAQTFPDYKQIRQELKTYAFG